MLTKEQSYPEQTHKEQIYTVKEFEHLLRQPENHKRLLELIDGEVVEKMPTEEHGYLAGLIVTAISNFLETHRIGIAAVEARHRLPNDEVNARLPDVSFRRAKHPLVKEGSVPQMPDLAVEIRSTNDTIQKMHDTAAYYIANGSRLVWLVFPAKRYVEVYRPDEEEEIIFGSDVLRGYDVLSGFELPVARLFGVPMVE